MSTCWMGKSCAFMWVCKALSGWLWCTGILYTLVLPGKAGWVVTCTHPDQEVPFFLPFPGI